MIVLVEQNQMGLEDAFFVYQVPILQVYIAIHVPLVRYLVMGNVSVLIVDPVMNRIFHTKIVYLVMEDFFLLGWGSVQNVQKVLHLFLVLLFVVNVSVDMK